MALTSTTLSAAVSVDALAITVASATGATVGGIVKVNDEYMFVDSISGTRIGVRQRGFYGTRVEAHPTLSLVTFGLVSDMAAVTRFLPDPVDRVMIGADGAIALPTRNTTFVINKATALATSAIADPSKEQDGLQVRFISATNAAHVVTTTTGHDGTTGLHTTWTFAAFIGAGFTLEAVGGKWMLVSSVAVTPS